MIRPTDDELYDTILDMHSDLRHNFPLPKDYETDEAYEDAEAEVIGQFISEIVSIIATERAAAKLEGRKAENRRYLTDEAAHYYPAGPGDPYIPIVQFAERLSGLDATGKETRNAN